MYEKLGRMTGRYYEETVQILIKSLKNAEVSIYIYSFDASINQLHDHRKEIANYIEEISALSPCYVIVLSFVYFGQHKIILMRGSVTTFKAFSNH